MLLFLLMKKPRKNEKYFDIEILEAKNESREKEENKTSKNVDIKLEIKKHI